MEESEVLGPAERLEHIRDTYDAGLDSQFCDDGGVKAFCPTCDRPAGEVFIGYTRNSKNPLVFDWFIECPCGYKVSSRRGLWAAVLLWNEPELERVTNPDLSIEKSTTGITIT